MRALHHLEMYRIRDDVSASKTGDPYGAFLVGNLLVIVVTDLDGTPDHVSVTSSHGTALYAADIAHVKSLLFDSGETVTQTNDPPRVLLTSS